VTCLPDTVASAFAGAGFPAFGEDPRRAAGASAGLDLADRVFAGVLGFFDKECAET
jgi:hypothetical protein